MAVEVTRLTTGEEIIARTTTKHDGTVKLTNPLILIPMEEGRLTFATWMPYLKGDSIVIKDSAIMFSFEPAEEMEKQYIEATSSIII